MTGWLIDTSIISQFAPGRGDRPGMPRAGVAEWLRRHSDLLRLSAVSIVEIAAGVEKMRRTGAGQRATELEKWLDQITGLYGDRVFPVSAALGKVAGRLADRARALGRHPGFADILIGATAQVHALGLVTENVRRFEPLHLGVPLLNPLTDVLP